MNGASLDEWTQRFLATATTAQADESFVSALQALCNEFTALVGRPGADALLARAMHLARQSNPAVARVGSDAPPSCEGIGEFLSAVDAPSVNEIVIPIGGQVLALLAGFIGDELTRNLLARLSRDRPGDPNEGFGR